MQVIDRSINFSKSEVLFYAMFVLKLEPPSLPFLVFKQVEGAVKYIDHPSPIVRNPKQAFNFVNDLLNQFWRISSKDNPSEPLAATNKNQTWNNLANAGSTISWFWLPKIQHTIFVTFPSSMNKGEPSRKQDHMAMAL
uniref:Uncharacterized protein n=1 Tax=Medicago truncatula TaxID=3880 RepID=Q1RU63_MEDTR|nr:hypothetical protein MtrDRAFT_AC153125g47v2 [Medicago truncatula]